MPVADESESSFKDGRTSIVIRDRALTFAAVAVNLAVTSTEIGGDGWESNPPRTPHSAPQTVLKTAGHESTEVHQHPPEFNEKLRDSTGVRCRLSLFAGLAVILAVMARPTLQFIIVAAPSGIAV